MTKQPQPGQYWRNRGGEIVLVAFDSRSVLKADPVYPLTILSAIGGSYRVTKSGFGNDQQWQDLVEYLPNFPGFENTVKPSAAEPIADESERDVFSIDNLDMRRETMASGGRISSAENQAILDVIEIAKRAIRPKAATTKSDKPQAGQWWVEKSNPENVIFIAGHTSDGGIVYEDRYRDLWDADDTDWSLMQHIPDCKGFNWTPEPTETPLESTWYQHTTPGVLIEKLATGDVRYHRQDRDGWRSEDVRCSPWTQQQIDNGTWRPISAAEALATIGATQQPETAVNAVVEDVGPVVDVGDGYELLPKGTRLQEGDEWRTSKGKWEKTLNAGFDRVGDNTYRRKIKPAEWPKWYASGASMFRRHENGDHFLVKSDGIEVKQRCDVSILDGKAFTQITEAEALARITSQPPAEPCAMCGDESIPGTGGCSPCTVVAIEATGCTVEDPEEWVPQDRVPARPGIDQGAYRSVGECDDDLLWNDSACINWGRPAKHGAKVNGDTLLLRCKRKDLPPIPQPQPADPETTKFTVELDALDLETIHEEINYRNARTKGPEGEPIVPDGESCLPGALLAEAIRDLNEYRAIYAAGDLPQEYLTPFADQMASATASRRERKEKPAEPAVKRIPDTRPARDVILDIVAWLDPHPPSISNPQKALETAEQWLVDTREAERSAAKTKQMPVRLWIADDDDPTWGYEIAASAEKPIRTHSPFEWREIHSDGNGGWFVEVPQ